jgi:hypothetical protein
MGWNKEQLEAWKKDYASKRIDRKKAAGQKLVDTANLKKTHDWATQFSSSGTIYPASSGMFVATHCKKCGLTIATFKVSPTECPKKE